jgi:tetratricopeptide (TPR) repeat protein
LLVCWIAASVIFLCQAQPRDTTRAGRDAQTARAVAERAERMAQAGDQERAVAFVGRQLQLARESSWSRPAMAQLSFTLGWLYHDLAANQPERRADLLKRSVASYRDSIVLYPGNTAASENLAQVLRELGRFDEAVAVLERIRQPDASPRQTYERLLLMGDLQTAQGEVRQAAGTYLKAFDLIPEDDRAPWRLISVYPSLSPTWSNERLFRLCQRFSEAGLHPVASRGYEDIVQDEARSGGSSALLSTSVEAWVDLQAQRGTLSAANFARLPANLFNEMPALAELKARLDDPAAPTVPFDFWLSSLPRRHIGASALRALAQHERLAGRSGNAAALYAEALEMAPEFSAYSEDSLRNRPLVRLETALDTAALFQANPELDPGGRKFRRMENELLSEKNMAYAESNLPVMEKYHTMLGLIYAGQEKWETDNWRAAPYHLERAVATAQRSAGRDPGEYQPLPHLTRMLADGLTLTGTNHYDKARQLYLDAAQGYLDADDLSAADTMLKQTHQLSERLAKPDPVGYGGLEAVLEDRKRIRTLTPDDFRSGAEAGARAADWLRPPTAGDLDPVFRQRQSVRMLEDLSTKADSVGATADAARIRKQAFEQLRAAPGATREDLQRVFKSPVRSSGQSQTGIKLLQGQRGFRLDQQLLNDTDLERLKEVQVRELRVPIDR